MKMPTETKCMLPRHPGIAPTVRSAWPRCRARARTGSRPGRRTLIESTMPLPAPPQCRRGKAGISQALESVSGRDRGRKRRGCGSGNSGGIGNEARYVRVAPFATLRPTLCGRRIRSLCGRWRLQVSRQLPARLDHGRVGPVLFSSPSPRATARRLPAGARTVIRRHLEPAIDRALKNIEFGLMTDPATRVAALPREGDLPCYYNAL